MISRQAVPGVNGGMRITAQGVTRRTPEESFTPLVEGSPEWMTDAACVGQWDLFDGQGDDETKPQAVERTAKARALCLTCPVFFICSTLDIERGVVAGVMRDPAWDEAAVRAERARAKRERAADRMRKRPEDVEHGTSAGFHWHYDNRRAFPDAWPACEPCYAAHRAREAERRAEQKARGAFPEGLHVEHGTAKGYGAHTRYGVPACEPCIAAERNRTSKRGAVKRGAFPEGLDVPHGTMKGWRAHAHYGAPMCAPCREAKTEDQRQRRAAKREQAEPTVSQDRYGVVLHGTVAAYQWHARHREDDPAAWPPCDPCSEAKRAYDVEREAANRAEHTFPEGLDVPHGTVPGARLHDRHGVPECEPCSAARRQARAEREARQSAERKAASLARRRIRRAERQQLALVQAELEAVGL